MSGGSYNYLCNATLSERDDDLRRMYDRLRELEQKAPAGPLRLAYGVAADATHRILAVLDVPDALSAAWKAVEWCDSSDWGDDQMNGEILRVASKLSVGSASRARITQDALDLFQKGSHLQAVQALRDVLVAAGCEVEPHPLELARVMELRAQARRLLDEATLLEDSL